MAKKTAVKHAKGAKIKKGTKYTCQSCGMVLSVVDPCGCSPCDVVCCGQDMEMSAC